jgi:hypothetical protein
MMDTPMAHTTVTALMTPAPEEVDVDSLLSMAAMAVALRDEAVASHLLFRLADVVAEEMDSLLLVAAMAAPRVRKTAAVSHLLSRLDVAAEVMDSLLSVVAVVALALKEATAVD